MKTLNLLLVVVFVMGSLFSCNAQKSENTGSNTLANDNVEIYYFHFTKRCVTCNAVEAETKLALASPILTPGATYSVISSRLQKLPRSFWTRPRWCAVQ